MADPSEDRPTPMKTPGSGSRSAGEENTRDRPAVPSGGDGDGSPPTLSLLPPATHPPIAQPQTAQAEYSGGRPTKKKAKMGKEATVGTKGAAVEESGKKRMSASLENLPRRARTCGICRREFATARALFGHMRCHPDRRWRGAHPPPVSPRREVDVEVEQTRQAEDLASSLLNIGQTILRTAKFKATEGDQAGGSDVGSSTAALVIGHGTGIETGWTKRKERAEEASGVEREGDQAAGSGVGSSTAAPVTGQGTGIEMGWMKRKERAEEASGVERGWQSSSSSGYTTKEKKKKEKEKEKTTKGLNYTDEDRRKQIHYQLDLNKEAPADGKDDDDDKEEKSDATSN